MASRQLVRADGWHRAGSASLRTRLHGMSWVPQALLVALIAAGLGVAVVTLPSLSQPWGTIGLLALVAPFVALIVGHPRQLLLAVVIVNIPIGLEKYFGWREDIGLLGSIGGWYVSAGTLALLGLYGLWLAGGLTRIDPRPRLVIRPLLPLLVYLGLTVLSLAVTENVTLSLLEIFWLAQLTMLSIYVASNVTTRRDALFVIAVIMIGLLLESILMIVLRVVGHPLPIPAIKTQIDEAARVGSSGVRVAGSVGSPNSAAAYVSFLLAPALALTFSRVPAWLRWLGAITFCLGSVALILTLSRGGMTSFMISLLILGAVALRRRWLSVGTVGAVAGVSMVAFAIFAGTLASRFLGSDNGAAYARIPLMKIAWNIIADHPFGVGINNFATVLPHYVGPQFANSFIYTAHNLYLTIWAEIGLVGLLVFLWFLVTLMRRAWRCGATLDRDLAPFAIGVLAATTGQLFHMFVDVFKGWPQLQSLWLIAGLLVAMSMLPDKTAAENDDRGAG